MFYRQILTIFIVSILFLDSFIWAQVGSPPQALSTTSQSINTHGVTNLGNIIPTSITNVIQSIFQNLFGLRSDKNTTLIQGIRIDRVFDPVQNKEISNTGNVTNFKIKNNGSEQKDYFVPYKSEKEWAAFLQNHPLDVKVCNDDTSAALEFTNISAGSYAAIVGGCNDCVQFLGDVCSNNAECGDGGACNFVPQVFTNVTTQSICNGLAINATQPTFLMPDPNPTNLPLNQAGTVVYNQSLPIQTQGTVKYIARYLQINEAKAIAAATGYETEWLDPCATNLTQPSWDPGIYPTSNAPLNFWDTYNFRACVFDITPLNIPGSIGRAWNLETGTCDDIFPIISNVGSCTCPQVCPTYGQFSPGRHVCGTVGLNGNYTAKGLAWGSIGGTMPALFNPVNAGGLVNAGGVNNFVTYQSLPAYTGGTVKYITSPSRLAIVNQHSCSPIESFSDCWTGETNPPPIGPDWDTGNYPVIMNNGKDIGYDSFWDREDFLNCISLNDSIPSIGLFANPDALAFVWNLETDQCEEFIPGM